MKRQKTRRQLKLPGSDHNADSNRQIKGGALLFQIRRGEIDGYPAGLHLFSAVDDCRVYTVPAFPDRSARKTDDFHSRHSVNAEHFHMNRITHYPADAKAQRSGHDFVQSSSPLCVIDLVSVIISDRATTVNTISEGFLNRYSARIPEP